MKVAAKTRKLLRAMELELGPESKDLGSSFEDFLLSEIRRTTKVYDDPYKIDEQLRNGLYKHCTENQWTLARVKFFEMIGLNIAAYRRITRNDPVEYARLLSVASRQEWLDAKINWNYERENIWRPLMGAVASNDMLCVQRLIELWETRFDKSHNRIYEALTVAVIAMFRKDTVSLKDACEKLAKRKCYPYVLGVKTVILGVANESAESVRDGLDLMLKKFKSYMYGDAKHAIIDPFALGLYELVRTFSPGLLSAFDVSQELPWDGEYAVWRESCAGIEEEYRKLTLPSFMKGPLVEMIDMDWAPDNRPPASRD